MREIKFRAKDLQGNWVYGFYGKMPHEFSGQIKDVIFNYYGVDKESITLEEAEKLENKVISIDVYEGKYPFCELIVEV